MLIDNGVVDYSYFESCAVQIMNGQFDQNPHV